MSGPQLKGKDLRTGRHALSLPRRPVQSNSVGCLRAPNRVPDATTPAHEVGGGRLRNGSHQLEYSSVCDNCKPPETGSTTGTLD
jgi:hypothetical protein